MRKNKNKNDSLSRVFSNNIYILKIAFHEAPFYTITQIFGLAKNRLIVFIEHVYMIGYIINAIEYKQPFMNVFTFILSVFIVVTLWCNVWGNILNTRLNPVATEKINRRIRMDLYKKASEIDLKCYDDPEFYTNFVWAMNEASTRVYSVIGTFSDLIGSIVAVLLAGGYMLSQDPIGIVFVLFSFFGIFFVNSIQNKVRLDLLNRLKPHERKSNYIARVLYLADHAKEIRLNNVKGRLYKDFNDAVKELRREANKGTWKLAILSFLSDFVFNAFLIDCLYMLFLLYRKLVKNAFGYGTMVNLYRTCNQMRYGFSVLSKTLPAFQEHSLYIEKIRSFLEYKINVKSPEIPLDIPQNNCTIELENVSFSYNKENVLKNINLKINKGEHIAFVGYNGAGKTTLIKLLMRLYDVSEGRISYGGTDIKELSLEEYRGVFETVFQDYQLFAATVGENIVMDNIPLDEIKAEKALRDGGFYKKLAELKNGLSTSVTKEFDDEGVLLSGGESQSLVISRALYKDSPVLILDEPSSALDPLAEYNLNKTMMDLNKDKTVIIISHRLSTTKNADKIYMLENGEIVEQGNHDELMKLNGKYAYMFNLQAEKYRSA